MLIMSNCYSDLYVFGVVYKYVQNWKYTALAKVCVHSAFVTMGWENRCNTTGGSIKRHSTGMSIS